MAKRKVTAASVRRDATGRWLAIFQYMCPGMFDDAIRNLGDHVTCPFHGGEDDFRFVAVSTKKGLSTDACGVAMCTCGVFSDGLNVLERALNCSFSEILKEVDEYLNGPNVDAGAPSAPKALPMRAPVPLVEQKPRTSDEDLMQKRRALWNPAPAYDPVTTPYYGCRGIRLDVLRKLQSLRVTPGLAYYQKVKGEVDDRGRPKIEKVGVFPAILGLMRDAEGHPVAIHRTWLNQARTGKAPVKKAKKLSETNDARGGAVRLFDATGCEDLGLTEGIETGISSFQLAMDGYFEGLGELPVWACYSKDNMKNFVVPAALLPTLKRIVIFADNDAKGAGLQAAEKTRELLLERYPHLVIEIRMPTQVGADWNDVVMDMLEPQATALCA